MTGEIPNYFPNAERPQGSALLQTSIYEVGENLINFKQGGLIWVLNQAYK